MKVLVGLILVAVSLSVQSCGKAAEDRAATDARNKIIQDSMVNTIKGRMQEPFVVIYGQPNPPQQLQPVSTNTAAPTSSVK